MADVPDAAVAAYREFHGAEPDELLEVDVPEELGLPRYLVAIGKCEEIVYQPLKPSTKAGKFYEHKFGDYGDRRTGERPLLCMDPQSRGLFILPIGSHFYVNRRGIVG